MAPTTCQRSTNNERKVWLILLFVCLLTLEYTLQRIHNERLHRTASKSGGAFVFAVDTIPKSTQYIEEKEIYQCRFPSIYDAGYFTFDLRYYSYVQIGNWREGLKQDSGDDEDMESVMYELEWTQKQRQKDLIGRKDLSPVKRNVTYVHIGKAGGSTLSCNIRAGRRHSWYHCDSDSTNSSTETYDDDSWKKNPSLVPLSAISRSVDCYTHWSMHLGCFFQEDEDRAFLVNVRSPLKRSASWFTYEHSENHDIVYDDRDHHCGQLILNSCYQQFEHLTTVGLSFPRPPLNQPLRVGLNLTVQECSHWAWATVQGNMPADYHNSYNYDYYAHRLFQNRRNRKADILALRVEHLEQDWTTIDTMLGGDGSFPTELSSRQNAADEKPLRIPNHNTTDVGLRNLCRALCDEIQVYKRLLLRAVNLNKDDIEQSIAELREDCPEETDIYPRVCDYGGVI